ncbi:MAG: DNA polymerase, partial [Bdellovibrionaceae bacterium]|nr:DNA polymerase [Pseudobdellovibrionaceae bacterium]
DPGLTRAFAAGVDIHTATAAEVFGVAANGVTSEQRRKAKAVNFGLAYGQGAFGLAEALQISRSEATEIIGRYFNRFAGVKTFMDDTIETAKKQGYVETLFGRRRYLDELFSKSPMVRKFGERAAINAPIQGTAADIVKKAMIEAHRQVPTRMLLQVHDELIFEAPREQAQDLATQAKRVMENAVKLNVPLDVNVGVGFDWDAAHS